MLDFFIIKLFLSKVIYYISIFDGSFVYLFFISEKGLFSDVNINYLFKAKSRIFVYLFILNFDKKTKSLILFSINIKKISSIVFCFRIWLTI